MLRPYQKTCSDFLQRNPAGGLFVDMGLGKTLPTLKALATFPGQTLLVGPIRVIESVWQQEAEKWGIPLTFSLVRGTPKQRLAALSDPADVYLVNPEVLKWLYDNVPITRFENLVIDESSMFASVGSARFKLLRFKLRHFRRRYILTGTPTPNSLLELWTQIFILDLGKSLGTSFTRYKEKYFYPVDYFRYRWEPKPNAREEIYARVKHLLLRLDAKDYKNVLPKLSYNRIDVDLPPSARKAYNSVEQELFAALDNGSMIMTDHAASALMKCRQIANGFVYSDLGDDKIVTPMHDAKLSAAEEIIAETGTPVLLVYNFRHELDALKAKLKKYNPVVLTDSKDSAKTIQQWNAGHIRVLLLHPQSGGHGLNLQKGPGHTLVWFGLTYSWGQFVQTNARLARSGQASPVMAHLIAAADTVDLAMGQALKRKRDGEAHILDSLRDYQKR